MSDRVCFLCGAVQAATAVNSAINNIGLSVMLSATRPGFCHIGAQARIWIGLYSY